jgi:mRNA interferase RelE/StbE
MNWQIKIANTARKNLKKFPTKDKEKIKSALSELVFNPYAGDLEKMEGEENSWRRRVGVYRIFFDIDKKNKIINITSVQRRTSSTY